MKVLYLTNIPSPYRVDFFNILGQNCELTVIYEMHAATDRDVDWKAKRVENFTEVYLDGWQLRNDGALSWRIIRYLSSSLYDVIIVGGYSTPTSMLAIEYMRLKHINFLINCDGGMIKTESKLAFAVKKHFLSSASGWLSTANECDRYLIYYGANSSEIYRYPFTSVFQSNIHISPASEKSKREYRQILGMQEQKIVISVGQFIHRKGYDVLLESCRNISKEVGIYIIGGNPTEDYLKLQNDLNLTNVHFVPFKKANDLEKYYLAADLFVLPTRGDVWGLVINEAMAHGLPIITTNKCVSGLEMIEDGINGFIVPTENACVLYEKINDILTNPPLMERMAQNNLKKIQRYSLEEMSKVHIEIFNKIQEK